MIPSVLKVSAPGRSSRWTRWTWLMAVVAIAGASAVLAFLLSMGATAERGFFERNYVWLYWLNVAMAGLLTLILGGAGVRLYLQVRQQQFGSQLLAKLAGIFALVGVVPGLLIYTVSYQFVNRSIEAWFDVKLASALEAGLKLGQSTLDSMNSELASKTRNAAERLPEQSVGMPMTLALERVREQLSVRSVTLLGPNGQVLATAGAAETLGLAPQKAQSSWLKDARRQGVISRIEGLEEDGAITSGSAQLRAVAPVPSTEFSLGASERYLMTVQALPGAMVANALAVQSANAEYQQRALEREGMRHLHIGTLTLVLILAVFAALLLAVALGNQLARPLLLLADGVRQVAQGDLTAKPVLAARDELAGLTRSFADMTQQLADARHLVDQSVAQLESARTHLQTILDNLTAGVIVLNADGTMETLNPGASRILRLPMLAHQGEPLSAVVGLEAFAEAVQQRFEASLDAGETAEHGTWQDSFELQRPGTDDVLTLLVRGALLPLNGRLIVFDDISEVVSAQRSAAWSEVARRLAHEIKNPLTPIQLSAERLQHKLEAKLEGTDQAMLVRSVSTIVNQVQAMKQLVNEFRDYARLPAARLLPLDLNALVQEVLQLYASAQEAGRLTAELVAQPPAIVGDATQMRQVIHNLVQNALDAVSEREQGHVLVRTQKNLGDTGEVRGVRLVISDNGPGFAEKVLKRAFEPYVTTKSKGTGLGLAVVKKIADEHGARIRLANLHFEGDEAQPVIGAQVSISFSKLATAPGSADVGDANGLR